ncbi:unnamed protein product [Lymnaea stagnalis]|uniref:Sialin n=1 Tax=Lymnaea stagnalis TaxID=6523 RepID=A0AAV2ILU7_LYMST
MSKQLVTRTVARKVGNTLGLLVPGIFVLGVGYFDCGRAGWAVTLLVIGVSMSGFQYGAGFLTNPGDIAPQYAGIIFGLSNTFATLPGFIVPSVIGYITTDQTQSQWQTVFYIASAIYAFGALFFIVFASGEIQDWAVERTEMEVVVKSNEQGALSEVVKSKQQEPSADVINAKDGRLEASADVIKSKDGRLEASADVIKSKDGRLEASDAVSRL